MRRHYISPKDSRAFVDFAKLAWPLIMRLKHGNVRLKIVGDGSQRFKELKNRRVVICPNHSSEEDSEVIFGISRVLRETFNYLTAHEIFHANRGLNGVFLPRLGCYSIDRGRRDVTAYKTTRDLLVSNRRKLVAFPEGEVSHLNDVIMPLERGVVQISFAALEKLNSEKIDDTILVLPLAIKYFISEDVDEQLDHSLKIIEKELDLCTIDDLSYDRRAKRALLQFVARLEHRFDFVSPPDTSFAERMVALRWKILKCVADKLNVALPEFELQIESAHMLKGVLCDLHFHHAADTKFDTLELKTLFKDVLTVIHLIAVEHSFIGTRNVENKREHVFEIVEILECALFKKTAMHGSQLILVKIGEPIDLREFLEPYEQNRSAAVQLINGKIRDQLISMLSELEQMYRSNSWAN